MAGVLSQVAPGLLSALQLKQRGFNPDSLSATVQPIIDLSHWYANDTSESQVASASMTRSTEIAGIIPLTFTPVTVPDNEIWWVRFAGARLLTGGTTTDVQIRSMGVSVGSRAGATIANGPSIETVSFAAAIASKTFVSPSLTNFWAPPGAVFFAYFAGIITDGASNPTLFADVWFDRFLI
jgi:hypothetical protein